MKEGEMERRMVCHLVGEICPISLPPSTHPIATVNIITLQKIANLMLST